MKKVLFVTESLACGGMEKVLTTIANVLNSRNYKVTILCYNEKKDLLDELDDGIEYIYKPRRKFNLLNRIPHIRRYYNYRKAVWEHRVSGKTLYKYYVGSNEYDVEIAFYRGPAIKIVSGSTNNNSKKIAWVHTDFMLCDPKTIVGWFNDLEEAKLGYGKMDKIVCVSNKAKDSFEKVIGFSAKTTTIYNMISSSRIREMSSVICPIQRRKFTIISVGRLIPDKCYDRLLMATKRLNSEGYDFDVWIVGSGRSEDDLKNYCVNNCINNITFLGKQNNPYTYLKQASIFVLCSKREGFALVIPEAMTCGLPVISTKCTGPTEILDNGQYGVLVESNTEGIYDGIKSFLDDPNKLLDYRTKSLRRFMDFDEQKIVDEIIEVIDR